MDKLLYHILEKIPLELENKILSYLIPDSSRIVFHKIYYYCTPKHNSIYEKGFVGHKEIKNEDGLYLSRIPKKNGKHRYYISKRIISDIIHVEYNDREYPIYMYEYVSTYSGKDINKALIKLLI